MKLKDLRAHWERLLINPYAFWKEAWRKPANREFFIACWESFQVAAGDSVRLQDELSGWEELLDRVSQAPGLHDRVTPGQIQSARLHLAMLNLMGRPFSAKATRRELEALADRFGKPLGTVLDLECELCQTPSTGPALKPKWTTRGSLLCGCLRPAGAQVTIPVLFELLPPPGAEADGQQETGTVASLTLEWIGREERSLVKGTGSVYHVPALDFVIVDEACGKAPSIALQSLRNRGLQLVNADIRYRLELRSATGNQVFSRLAGPSLCRAFELGLLKLFSLVEPDLLKKRPELGPIADMPLGGVAVSAGYAPDPLRERPASKSPAGRAAGARHRQQSEVGDEMARLEHWNDVGGLMPKLIAAARATFPPIHTVLVAKEQVVDAAASGPVKDIGFGQLSLLKAANLEEAVGILERDLADRWSGLEPYLPPLPEVNVPRVLFQNRIETLVAANTSGFIEITGEMARGKSTAMAQLVHNRINSGHVPLFYFIGKSRGNESTDPNHIARSLYFQLRLNYAFEEPFEWRDWPVEKKLAELMLKVSKERLTDGGKEVIFLDGADQIVGGSPGALAPTMLNNLPAGFFCVITTRPEKSAWRGKSVLCLAEDRFADLVDEEHDERLLLEERVRRLQQARRARGEPPLAWKFKFPDDIVAKPFPTMFVLDSRLRSFEYPVHSDPKEDELCAALQANVEYWRTAPYSLVKQELERVLDFAENPDNYKDANIGKIGAQRALNVLAVHMCAGRPVSPRELQALDAAAGNTQDPMYKLWDKGTEIVLNRAKNLFRRSPADAPEANQTLEFYHKTYIDVIRKEYTPTPAEEPVPGANQEAQTV